MLSLLIVSVIFGLAAGQVEEVSFSAGLDHNINLQQATKIVFNKVFSNKGNGYDNTNGEFTCPTSGFYVLQFHMLAQDYRAAWLELYKNKDYVLSTFGHNGDDYASGGNSVILHLAQGDVISIQSVDNTYGYNTNLYGVGDEVYCTFSGYLIHAD